MLWEQLGYGVARGTYRKLLVLKFSNIQAGSIRQIRKVKVFTIIFNSYSFSLRWICWISTSMADLLRAFRSVVLPEVLSSSPMLFPLEVWLRSITSEQWSMKLLREPFTFFGPLWVDFSEGSFDSDKLLAGACLRITVSDGLGLITLSHEVADPVLYLQDKKLDVLIVRCITKDGDLARCLLVLWYCLGY